MRPIDADALVAKMKAYDIWHETEYQDGYFDGFSDGIAEVKEAPTIEAEPVKHGRWVMLEDYCGDEYWKCSTCGEHFYFELNSTAEISMMKYCANCGAKMDLEG